MANKIGMFGGDEQDNWTQELVSTVSTPDAGRPAQAPLPRVALPRRDRMSAREPGERGAPVHAR